jgi:hypothetical protein
VNLYVLTKINTCQKTAYFETKFKDVSPTNRVQKTSALALYILSQPAQNYAHASAVRSLFAWIFLAWFPLGRISELGPQSLTPKSYVAAWAGCE